MTTFTGWNDPNSLMHFRTKGSKNGVRRFQNEDGTWTPLGLRERKEREGWGDGEGGVSRRERRAQRSLERAERHQARKEARAEARAAAAERKRQNSLKGLTDDELRKKIDRLKLEQEYKELSKSPVLKTGEKLVTSILEYQGNKEQREIERKKQEIEMARIKTERIKAVEGTKRAKEERLKVQKDVEGGLAKERKANLLGKKMEYKNYTIRGGLARRINMKLTSGKAKQYEAERKAIGEGNAARIKSDFARSLKQRQQSQREKDLAPERRREEKLRKERERSRREYEKRMKRITNF